MQKLLLDLRKTSDTPGLPSEDSEILLSDGSDADASLIAEKVVLDFGGDPGDAGILRKSSLDKLVAFNIIMGTIHLLQAIVMIVLATDFSLPVTTSYQTFDLATSSLVIDSKTLFEIPLVGLIIIFLLLSSGFHFYLGLIRPDPYQANLRLSTNPTRFIEYSLSASTMMLAIAMLAGIEDLSTLLMVFILTMIMNLLGLSMEKINQGKRVVDWLSFKIGILAGIVPWVVIGVYFWGSSSSGNGMIPTFVYYIYLSIFIFFNCFALNMYLQYKKIGRWNDYIYGEKVFILLSLLAKSALAWQIFFGTLRPV
ncbi:heliorhodopsin HeR [Candidatus Nomurabacteria bacterium]|nr:heliorhodopsin HeR [Candidatus Nomurabacteria bacterium]